MRIDWLSVAMLVAAYAAVFGLAFVVTGEGFQFLKHLHAGASACIKLAGG